MQCQGRAGEGGPLLYRKDSTRHRPKTTVNPGRAGTLSGPFRSTCYTFNLNKDERVLPESPPGRHCNVPSPAPGEKRPMPPQRLSFEKETFEMEDLLAKLEAGASGQMST